MPEMKRRFKHSCNKNTHVKVVSRHALTRVSKHALETECLVHSACDFGHTWKKITHFVPAAEPVTGHTQRGFRMAMPTLVSRGWPVQKFAPVKVKSFNDLR
ncbi:hypothetical protein RRG08_013557 [Elysia crispata]|uniref:Uncharacterized protein n=1 Tax=Elysia crispata TaxID=231223 RepID=A0AAE0Y0N1_9GAST|nr:hypothetical protein RRG08_013557 [Elysia crispata]